MPDLRQEFVKVFGELVEKYEDIYFLVDDVGYSFLEGLEKKLGRRFINCGIMEEVITGIAAGLAKMGKKPYYYSMIPFVLFRNAEQVRNDIVGNNLNVKLIGVKGSERYAFLGKSHNLLHPKEDINFCENIGLDYRIPQSNEEVRKVILETYNSSKACYIRL